MAVEIQSSVLTGRVKQSQIYLLAQNVLVASVFLAHCALAKGYTKFNCVQSQSKQTCVCVFVVCSPYLYSTKPK